MKTGKITAKLRDAVPVCLMVGEKEVKRYKNIELPDAIKELEMVDFHFNVPADGKITFEIQYADGVLPEVFPAARAKMTRAEKNAMRAKTQTAPELDTATETTGASETSETTEESSSAVIERAPARELPAVIIEPAAFFKPEEAPANTTEETAVQESPIEEASAENAAASEDTNESNNEQNQESGTMEIFYNVTGPRRKELVAAISEFIGEKSTYLKAPTYAYTIGNYTVSRYGTLTGKENKALVEALAAQGFKAA
ncbi:MAG: hypothetical protein Q4C91_02585 [Eubacteriales bacterium]|nr:hypothetical protein [Eubacteriales bacterium]